MKLISKVVVRNLIISSGVCMARIRSSKSYNGPRQRLAKYVASKLLSTCTYYSRVSESVAFQKEHDNSYRERKGV